MLTAWNAVSTLDRMLDDVMGSMVGTATSPRTFDPPFDVRSTENEVRIVGDVPGVKEADLEITVENRVLSIKGARRFETKDGEQVMLGRAYGAFEKTFALPEYLDEANLEAHLEGGVLEVRIPKQAQAKPRKIQITNGSGAKPLRE